MLKRFCVSLTRAPLKSSYSEKEDADRATVAFVVANAALGCDQETLVFLSTEGVRLAVCGIADEIREEGFAPLKQLMTQFVEGGGLIYVCSPCFLKRNFVAEDLIPGAKLVGGASLVEFLASGASCITY